MSDRPASIFVATPTTNGIVASAYALSLMNMAADLRGRGVEVIYRLVDGPNLAIQRDVLAHEFLRSRSTHILFIDRHMTFPPDLGATLLDAARPLVGTLHPRAAPDLRRLGQLLAEHGFEAALALAHDWDVELIAREVRVDNGLCRVRALGAGFLLVERDALNAMADEGGRPLYDFEGGALKLRALFRTMPDDPPDPDPDRTFCRRWHQRGGEVWAYVSAHVGPMTEQRYGMAFESYLDSVKRADRASSRPPAGGFADRS